MLTNGENETNHRAGNDFRYIAVGLTLALVIASLVLVLARKPSSKTNPPVPSAVVVPVAPNQVAKLETIAPLSAQPISFSAVETGNRASLLGAANRAIRHTLATTDSIGPIFTVEVQYWRDKIKDWAAEYDLDPNLVATIMQIESCGNPHIVSFAGAQGLFQVMPFHFQPGEDMQDPDTNAAHGLRILKENLAMADGDVGVALAAYNAGPSITRRVFRNWARETNLYYEWGTNLYQDALARVAESPTMDYWLNVSSGSWLCGMAHAELFQPDIQVAKAETTNRVSLDPLPLALTAPPQRGPDVAATNPVSTTAQIQENSDQAGIAQVEPVQPQPSTQSPESVTSGNRTRTTTSTKKPPTRSQQTPSRPGNKRTKK